MACMVAREWIFSDHFFVHSITIEFVFPQYPEPRLLSALQWKNDERGVFPVNAEYASNVESPFNMLELEDVLSETGKPCCVG